MPKKTREDRTFQIGDVVVFDYISRIKRRGLVVGYNPDSDWPYMVSWDDGSKFSYHGRDLRKEKK
jgi:hypothetical protein